MNRASSNAISESDTTARSPIMLLVWSATKWLVIAGVLGLIHSIQRHTPSFLQSVPALTYGRTQAMAETAFVYGWAANSAFAVALWILARLGGAPWRGLGLLTGGTLFWNLGIAAGVVCIAAGEGTTVQFLQIPAYLHPVLLVAAAAISTPAVLAWTGRRTDGTFTAQWFAVAALFLFPWLYSAGQVMLLSSPLRGVGHAVVAAWFAQNVMSLWLAPVALAAAYYLVPKITGKPVAHYGYSAYAFWVLVTIGSWTGVRHLAGGPVPTWIPSLGISSATLMLFHYVLVAINLKPAFSGSTPASLGFVRAGLVAYIAGGVITAVVSYETVAGKLQFTYFDTALLQLFLGGAFTLIVLGALYELVPRVTGVAWPSPGKIRAHYVLALGGLSVSTVALAAAGWVQGNGMLKADTSFAAIAAGTKPFLLAATAGEAAMLLGGMIFAAHSFRLLAASYLPGGIRSVMATSATVS